MLITSASPRWQRHICRKGKVAVMNRTVRERPERARSGPSVTVLQPSTPASEPAGRQKCALSPSLKRQGRSEEHTSELQSRQYLVCRLLLEKKKRLGRSQPLISQKTHNKQNP